MLPRHLEIILEIDRRLLDEARSRFPGQEERVGRIGLVEGRSAGQIRMANLAIVGSHSTNGVAAIHSQLLRTTTVKDLSEMFPERFNNKTNGVTPRRWLLLANDGLVSVIKDAIGESWITDLGQLRRLETFAYDKSFRESFRKAKHKAKVEFANWLKSTSGLTVDPETIFDSQVKRIHEYKRQLLNALRIVVLYNRLRGNPDLDMVPTHLSVCWQGGPCIPPRQAHHQVHQQCCGNARRGPRRARAAQGSFSSRVLRFDGREADTGLRCIQPDIDRWL